MGSLAAFALIFPLALGRYPEGAIFLVLVAICCRITAFERNLDLQALYLLLLLIRLRASIVVRASRRETRAGYSDDGIRLWFSLPLLHHSHLIAVELDVLDHLLEMLHLSVVDLNSSAQRTGDGASARQLCRPFAVSHFPSRLALAGQSLAVDVGTL